MITTGPEYFTIALKLYTLKQTLIDCGECANSREADQAIREFRADVESDMKAKGLAFNFETEAQANRAHDRMAPEFACWYEVTSARDLHGLVAHL